MRYHEITEAQEGPLGFQAAHKMIADNDDLFDGVTAYVVNFESGIAAHPAIMNQIVAILKRTRPSKSWSGHALWRGECRGDYWREHFGRGLHSWSGNLDTALYFRKECYARDAAKLLMITRPVRHLDLETLLMWRMRLRQGESHYVGSQSERLVLDEDAVRVAKEMDDIEAAQNLHNRPVKPSRSSSAVRRDLIDIVENVVRYDSKPAFVISPTDLDDYDGQATCPDQLRVWQNPSRNTFHKIIERYREARGLIYSDGTLLIWDFPDLYHSDVRDYLHEFFGGKEAASVMFYPDSVGVKAGSSEPIPFTDPTWLPIIQKAIQRYYPGETPIEEFNWG